MLTHIWNRRERFLLVYLMFIWFIFIVLFWTWWIDPKHIGDFFIGFAFVTVVLLWKVFLTAYSFFFIYKMKRITEDLTVPSDFRIAMIVAKSPGEPFEVVMKTLQAMLDQKLPHDTWVADEDPSKEELEWYEAKGINLSCRKNDPKYHNDKWPRRKKCKEGNLSYFYDKFGYNNYDLVVQLDVDHIPMEGYLEQMVKPFVDDKVGYVAAPSICNLNGSSSWASRARVYSEAVFHGPIQSGSNSGLTPICIGSHYAVRTKAVKEIGGLGPELAEDYSTTLLLNAAGWKGTFSYDAEAVGLGPNTFSDLIVQDYQWARSLTILFLTLFPRIWHKLSFMKFMQFTFTQLWYPASAFIWLLSLSVPIIALTTNISPVDVSYTDFILRAAPQYIIGLIILIMVQRKGVFKPSKAPVISWEAMLFEIARWPWVLIATVEGAITVLFRLKSVSKITPKSKEAGEPLPIRTLLPYLVIVLANLLVIGLYQNSSQMIGYIIFGLLTSAIYIFLIITIVALHSVESESPIFLRLKKNLAHIGIISILLVVFVYQTFLSELAY